MTEQELNLGKAIAEVINQWHDYKNLNSDDFDRIILKLTITALKLNWIKRLPDDTYEACCK